LYGGKIVDAYLCGEIGEQFLQRDSEFLVEDSLRDCRRRQQC
jgi:hypothetical protein